MIGISSRAVGWGEYGLVYWKAFEWKTNHFKAESASATVGSIQNGKREVCIYLSYDSIPFYSIPSHVECDYNLTNWGYPVEKATIDVDLSRFCSVRKRLMKQIFRSALTILIDIEVKYLRILEFSLWSNHPKKWYCSNNSLKLLIEFRCLFFQKQTNKVRWSCNAQCIIDSNGLCKNLSKTREPNQCLDRRNIYSTKFNA